VEASWNTSTVILASRKRRRKGNPVVSDEIVMYGYEFYATLTTDRLHYRLQTRTLVREGTPRRRRKLLSGKRKERKNLVMGPKGVPDTKILSTFRLVAWCLNYYATTCHVIHVRMNGNLICAIMLGVCDSNCRSYL
jgi:hypothetical protein